MQTRPPSREDRIAEAEREAFPPPPTTKEPPMNLLDNPSPEFLLEQTAGSSMFSSTVPGLQTAWNSSSLTPLKICPRRYYYQIVLGYQPSHENVHLIFGTLLHLGHEQYAKHIIDHPHEEAITIAVEKVLHAAGARAEDGSWKPWRSEDKYKTLPNAIRTLVWYFEKFREDWLKTIELSDGSLAVEIDFKFDTGEPGPDGTYLIFGRMDRAANYGEDKYIIDLKSTKSSVDYGDYFERYSPDNQMSMYSFAANVAHNIPVRGVLIDASQVTVNFSRFRRGMALRDHNQLEEWYADTIQAIRRNEDHVEARHWPMNDAVCSLWGGCPYRSVCSKSPAVREMYLKSNYIKRDYDPLKARDI